MYRFPIVALDRLIDPNIPAVMTDNFGGAKGFN